MMTKTTLKALYVGGGGIVATWLAVAPSTDAPATPAAGAQPIAAVREASAEELSAQAERLRARSNGVALRPSKRNPFRFAESKTPDRAATALDWLSPPAPAPQPPAVTAPAVTLSGIAEKTTANGIHRTAVISNGTQIYLVSEGQTVAGYYSVVRLDREAVVLRDPAGTETTLALR